jgi:segregation and condensation protein B
MELKFILEALLFASFKALTVDELRTFLKSATAESEEEATAPWQKVKREEVQCALETLASDVDGLGRAYRLLCVAGAWQFVSRPEYGPWLRALLGVKARPPRLSQPALETLAIIAYRQPITRAEMEQIRGVSVDGVVQTLTERGLVEVTGKAEVPGRPSIYATTSAFLDYFGLRNLEELPAADELRRLPVEKPEGLLTVDQGLATLPPEELAQGSLPPEPSDDSTKPLPAETTSRSDHEPS